MKTIKMCLTATLVALTTFLFAYHSVNDYTGEWVNTDANTRGLTKLLVKIQSGKPYVHGFGSCSPKDCDWGKIKGTYFTTSGKNFLSANYDFNNGITKHIILQKAGDQLIAIVNSSYTDHRKPKTNYYTLKKKKKRKVLSFKGQWVNVDSNTRGLTKLFIDGTSTIPSLHGFGSCSPRDCDWGKINGVFFTEEGNRLISADYNFNSGISKKIILRRVGTKLKTTIHTTFRDNRPPQTNHYTMKKVS